jgi:hypothetical protein
MLAALRAAGGLDDRPLVRFPFAVRWKLAALFGSDKPEEGFARRATENGELR